MQGAGKRMIGVAGVMLIGFGLAPPRPATAQTPGPDPEAGGLLLRLADGSQVAAPLLSTDVELRISGMIARARVVQHFTNPGDTWVEGVYVFPLPEKAAVDHLDMRVGDRVIEGQIQEKERARRTYARARAAGRKASLVEQERPNRFTTAVANIGPGERVEVAIEYQETLRFDAGRFRLRLPLVAGPRYEPASVQPALAQAGALDVAPASLAFLHPDDGPRNPVHIAVDLQAGFPLRELRSPSHAIFAEELAETRHRLTLDDHADRDFVLEWVPAAGREPRAALLAEPRGEGADVLLMVLPPDAEDTDASLAREVVFVIDVSGSMGGASIRQARAALQLALASLGPGDRFNVIRFNHETHSLFPASVAASPEHRETARRWVDGLEADGGTEMAPALLAALAGGDDGQSEVRQVVFITDGSIGDEEALFGLIEASLGRSRLFPVGIGGAPNGFFLKRAARFGRGTATFVSAPADVEARMGELFTKLEAPVLTDVEVLWNDEVEAWPARVPDLYAGEPVVVSARLPRLVGEVTVRGRRAGAPWEVILPLAPDAREEGLGVLWARHKIASLVDSLAVGADPEAVRASVVAVALEHHLVSRYTSLVAVDVTPSRPRSEDLQRQAVPANLPLGYGAPALPATATPAALLRLVGGLLVLAALALRGRRS